MDENFDNPANPQNGFTPQPPVPRSKSNFVGVSLFALAVAGCVGVGAWYYLQGVDDPVTLGETPDPSSKPITSENSEIATWKKFSSEEEYREYLSAAQNGGSFSTFGRGVGIQNMALDSSNIGLPMAMGSNEGGSGGGAPSRVSETNIQVSGVDEPDILKTNGSEIYYSNQRFRTYQSTPIRTIQPDLSDPNWSEGVVDEIESIIERPRNLTRVFKGFPVDELAEISGLEAYGEMLLHEETLILFENDQVTGYDVSDPANPEEKWSYELDETQLHQARMKDGELYLVLRKYNYGSNPCPMPLLNGSSSITVPCTDIFFSGFSGSGETTFTTLRMDADSGSVERTTSFMASSQHSTVYMSANNLYVTHSYSKPFFEYFVDFARLEAGDLLGVEVIDRLDRVLSLDISERAKQVEFEVVVQDYLNSLTADERDRVEKELQNRLTAYGNEHVRELETTSIAKLDLDSMEIIAEGSVPGHPLNQFSLDEHEGNLRIAITVGGDWRSSADSVNDVYVLNNSMEVVGEALGMGLDERIYSVRFVGDQGYVVTFKQIDPFYVLDLSNPSNPEIKGELKIPGFSSYLHPLTETLILGVGREDNQAKLSLFDVSDPTNPTEVENYKLDAYWSDVQNNHHAFLQDDKHQIFFLPAGYSGLIYSYQNGGLELVRSVTGLRAERAVFIDDYLYVVGQEGIVVLDETNWVEVGRLEF